MTEGATGESRMDRGAYGRVTIIGTECTKRVKSKHLDSALRESLLLQALDHPNVIKMLPRPEKSTLCLQMTTYVPLHRTLLTMDIVRLVARDIAEALSYIHGKGVIHCDIKPDNILLDLVNTRAILADFGLARLEDEPFHSGHVYANAYRPPEVTGSALERFSQLADVFAYGVTLFNLVSLKPYADDSAVKSSVHKYREFLETMDSRVNLTTYANAYLERIIRRKVGRTMAKTIPEIITAIGQALLPVSLRPRAKKIAMGLRGGRAKVKRGRGVLTVRVDTSDTFVCEGVPLDVLIRIDDEVETLAQRVYVGCYERIRRRPQYQYRLAAIYIGASIYTSPGLIDYMDTHFDLDMLAIRCFEMLEILEWDVFEES